VAKSEAGQANDFRVSYKSTYWSFAKHSAKYIHTMATIRQRCSGFAKDHHRCTRPFRLATMGSLRSQRIIKFVQSDVANCGRFMPGVPLSQARVFKENSKWLYSSNSGFLRRPHLDLGSRESQITDISALLIWVSQLPFDSHLGCPRGMPSFPSTRYAAFFPFVRL